MPSILSRDGTVIAFERTGSGPPLVLVHGTSASGRRWARVLPQLQQRFTVFAVDRRGRGESGDAAAYDVEREVDDVAAVVECIGESVDLLGHSFGAICSLEAALRTKHLRRLVLYEPPIPVDGSPAAPESDTMRRLEACLREGDREGVLTIFFREMNGMPAAQFEQFKQLPEWPVRLAAAHTLPRELQAVDSYRFDAARFGKLDVPVLLMLGGDSSAYFSGAIDMIAAALPNARKTVLPGQRHVAMDTAPDLFALEVLAFLRP
jgi:pimeloyl-ACP methyl ester carboxylesterase